MRKIADAIIAAGFTDLGYLYEAGDDYAIWCHWGADHVDHFTRFDVAWTEEGDAVVSNPTEVVHDFVPADKEKVETPEGTAEVEELRSQLAALKAENETLRRKPLAKSAHQEFQDGGSAIEKTGNRRLDTLARIASAK